jgi:Flp pilus assembly protein TadD
VKIQNHLRDWGRAGGTTLRLRTRSALLLLAVLVGLVYANSLPNAFVFDDYGLVVKKRQIRSLDQVPRIFFPETVMGGYRPLRTASYAIDYSLFGLNPSGFRAFNIFYHFLNGSLLFIILRTILGQVRPALLASILFLIHPIQTDSVAYISGRRDLLFTLFYLAGFYCFVRYRVTGQLRYLGFAGVSYLLSLMSKEMAVSLPLLCFCYDLFKSFPAAGEENRGSWQTLREGLRSLFQRHKWFYLLTGALFVFVAWYYAFRVVARVTRQHEMWGGGLWPTLLTDSRIFAHYIKLLVFPSTLNADYSYNAFPISYSLADPRVLFALAILGAVGWGIFRLVSYEPMAAFGGVWFFITLLPVSQIIPHHEMMAEHYLYLPSAGFFLAVALLVERLLARSRHVRAIPTAVALVVFLLGVRTVVRNRDWKDDLTLWTKTVRTAPQCARARTNLGEIHLRKGAVVQARQEFLQALRIKPNDEVNHDNLGAALLRLGQLEAAEREFQEAARISPSFSSPKANLGLVHLGRGKLDEAEREFREALRSRRLSRIRRPRVLNNLGIVLAMKGRREEAKKMFEDAVRRDPHYADARGNLGKVYLEEGMPKEATVELTEATRLKGSDARFHHLLGEAYYQQGMKELAAIELAKALSLKSDFPKARALLEKIDREKASERGRRG